jgi:hypothetical protein
MKRAVLLLVALAACAGVLGLSKSGPQPFPHRKHVVAGVTCVKCHVGIEKDDRLHIPADETCVSCHAKPHDTRPCLGCHAEANALPQLIEAREHLIFDHGKHLEETRGNCMRCHVGIAEGDKDLRPPMASCFKCHDQSAASNASQCAACHKNLEVSGTLPQSHLAHDADWIREHGTQAAASGEACASCHKESFCASCHGQTVPVVPAAVRFADPFTPSVHRANFVARHSLEAKSEPGACSTCHQPDRCIACHTSRGVADNPQRSPHPPGWAAGTHGGEARRDPASCASCHDGAGQQLCISCHKVGGIGGNPHPPAFSSKLPLSAMPCRLCHR